MSYAVKKEQQEFQTVKYRLVVLEFDARYVNSTVDVYGAIGPGWIMGPEYDYPVFFQEQVGKYKIEKLREEIAGLGGHFYLKPDLDEQKDGNPLSWDQAAVAIPVASSVENADDVARKTASISIALEQSGLFTRGSVSDVREAKQGVQSVTRANTKAIWRPKWRGSWRGGALVQPNI